MLIWTGQDISVATRTSSMVLAIDAGGAASNVCSGLVKKD